MKTVYLIKSPSNNINFGCNEESGLVFIESAVDISFLNNVVIDGHLKLQIDQKSGEQWAGKATIWFIILSDLPLTNSNLEKELSYVRNIGNQLFRTTKLGQKFSYKDIYSIPNVSDTWTVEEMNINLSENGGFKEVYCLDRTKPIKNEGEFSYYETTGKTVNADLVFCVGSDNQQTQSQYIHITLPSHNISLDASGLRVSGSLDALNQLKDSSYSRTTKGMMLELYNNALTTENIFTSFLLLFQIIELIIHSVEATKISSDLIEEIINKVKECELEDPIFVERISGSLRSLNKETSIQLLEAGVNSLIGSPSAEQLDFTKFASWRKFRGKITHPKSTQNLTDTEFVNHYKNLRSFIDSVIIEMIENNG